MMMRTRPPNANPARQRGLALVMVLWAAVMLALIAGGVTRLSRGDLDLARNLTESAQAELAADSALWTAVYMIVNGGPAAWRTDGTVYAWRFGDAEVRVRVTDELGRIDINAAPADLLAALFVAAGTEPEDAAALADAVVAYRSPSDEASGLSGTGRPPGSPDAPFALTDELEQVPGLPPGLQRRIAPAITVYTGQPRPRSATAPPLVLAATEGGPPAAAGEEATAADDAETLTLGGEPAILSEPAEAAGLASGLFHVEAEAASAGGSYFSREAVIELRGREAPPYRLRLWRRGARILFPVPEGAE